jgi:predicted MPP superfamily phosphohydrolase
MRIVHLTDLHIARTGLREEKLLQLVEAQQPDLIVLTGDYLNLSNLDDPIALEDARELLAQLSAPLGVYAVSGSVDAPYHMRALFSGLAITVLDNEVVPVPTKDGLLYIVGITNSSRNNDAYDLAVLMDEVPDSAYSILLYHTPDLIEHAEDEGVDLYFAGHTHGGQIRLPFYGAIFTSSAYGKQYEMGYYAVGDTILYVSRGIGMEGSIAPRARFLCPPEVVVLDLDLTEMVAESPSKTGAKTILQPAQWITEQTRKSIGCE